MADTYDLIVLGSGPGGYVAAIRAAQLGLKTAIVERELLGGICLNWGCIPTKALLRSGEMLHHMRHADSFGLVAGEVKPDLAKIVARSRAVAKQLNQGVTHLMKKNKITVHMGEGTITAPGKMTVTARMARRPSWPPSISSSPPARGPASCPSPSRTARRSGPIATR